MHVHLRDAHVAKSIPSVTNMAPRQMRAVQSMPAGALAAFPCVMYIDRRHYAQIILARLAAKANICALCRAGHMANIFLK